MNMNLSVGHIPSVVVNGSLSSWRTVRTGVLQSFNWVWYHLTSLVIWTVGLSATSESLQMIPELRGVVDSTLEARDAIQKDFDRLERWAF